MANYFSQYQQDKFLNQVVFLNKQNGFFVDIGAHDGVTINNTLYFEKFKNWSGICIEPNPLVFQKLVINRKSTNLNICIGNENKKVKFTQIEGYSEMLSGITDKYDNRHLERITKEILAKGGIKKEIEVEMFVLSNIEALKNKTIDFISIDTEGNELDIVQSINFEVMNIKALVIENNYKDQRLEHYLNTYNYKLVYRLDCDEVFVNDKELTLGLKIRIFFWKINSKLKVILNKIGFNEK